eukprot:s395_g6.t1
MVTLWLQAVSAETPPDACAKPGGYADDIHAVASKAPVVQQIVNITEEYASLSGQEISAEKSFTFAVTVAQRQKLGRISMGGKKLKVKSNVDLLGVSIAMDQSRTGSSGKGTKADKRAQKAKARFQRLRYAPLDFDCRETIAGISALSPLVYGQAGKTFPPQVLASLRRHAFKGIWHGAGLLSCAEVAFTLFLKGHRVDPVQATDFSCLQTLRRVVSNNTECRALANEVWSKACTATRRSLNVCGPVTRAVSLFRSIGWQWHCFDNVVTHTHLCLPLFLVERDVMVSSDESPFQHELREGLRLREWKDAAKRRRDMTEISVGIQREITTALHSDKDNLTEYQRACLRAVICGGVNTSGRQSLHSTKGWSHQLVVGLIFKLKALHQRLKVRLCGSVSSTGESGPFPEPIGFTADGSVENFKRRRQTDL